MSRTSNVFARVEPDVKEQAEVILTRLGIPMSNAIGMFLRQVVIQRGIPFEVKLNENAPLMLGNMTKEELNAELEKGMKSCEETTGYDIQHQLHAAGNPGYTMHSRLYQLCPFRAAGGSVCRQCDNSTDIKA